MVAYGRMLEGKAAIVTGAATGIGEAIAHKFAREGAAVLVNGMPDDPVTEVVASINEHGGRAVGFVGDVSIDDQAAACVRAAVEAFGKLDILVNNAGVFPEANETQDYSLEAFDNLIKNNVRTAFLMTKHALPHLQKSRGVVLCTGSESGKIGIAEVTPYGGTKAFLHAFMQGVAVEQAKHGVRANCVCPGAVDTAWTHKESGPFDRKMEKSVIEATPLGRRGTPEEIANVFCFLASDEASYVTGALWSVDGGITIAKGSVGSLVPASIAKPPKGELPLEHSRAGEPRRGMERP